MVIGTGSQLFGDLSAVKKLLERVQVAFLGSFDYDFEAVLMVEIKDECRR